jgi:hypothetical protein
MEGIMSLRESSFWQYAKRMGFLMADTMVHVSVFIPKVSENISTQNPIRKANVMTQLIFTPNDMRIIKYINMSGVA